uniref:ribonuclease H n=1 Tax=Cyprinus carpio carpio TaxID=630221 RepID=A0A9J7XGM7_CYPCA
MDYWIRLNNAIDIADECLKRQRRSVEDPGREVCMMFIKFCPDPILSNRLSFKAAEEWTTSEVQERIDAYQRELRMRTLTSSHTPQRHIVTHTQSAMSREPELSQPAPAEPQFQLPFSQGLVPPQATMFANASVQTPTSQLSPLAEQFVPNSPAVHLPQPSHAQSVPQHAQSPAFFQAPQSSHATTATAAAVGVNSMNALISLLDHLVVRQNVQAPAHEPSYAPMPFQRRSCRVCDDVRHSTLAHCRRENLCLACFAPGHWKKDCDKYGRKRVGQADASRGPAGGKLESPHLERGSVGDQHETLIGDEDLELLYVNACSAVPEGLQVVVQGSAEVPAFSELFYVQVVVNDKVELKGMVDSGSMACTMSEGAEALLKAAGVLLEEPESAERIVLVGCGGKQTRPKGVYDLTLSVYGVKCAVPVLLVPGQRDELIIGLNVLKHLARTMKSDENYWRLISAGGKKVQSDCDQFLDMLSCSTRWKSEDVPDKIGPLKLPHAVTLEPQHEHLVWGRQSSKVPMSPGSTVIVEPCGSRSSPRDVLVGRVITAMWADRWVPLKMMNLSPKPITLRRNAIIADVFPCLAVEDFNIQQGLCEIEGLEPESVIVSAATDADLKERLSNLGLSDLDIDSCQASFWAKKRLVELVGEYDDIFSRHSLDCGEAREFVHNIRLTDDRPFRMPYRRVPPAHYQQLRRVLSDMEERGIIRKSISEYASPLVMVWKKDGGLRICTDFRWLNARTLKDAHPLPHQADCLAALGGNAVFSTMDLTSGFYNVPMCEDHKKYTAFTTPVGLYEYNRMLCNLDDLLVFAPTEEEALNRLQVVFSKLRDNNLKLSPKKCHLLMWSVRFLGHVIDQSGVAVAVDPTKVDVICKMPKEALMEEDGRTPSVKRLKSFLGMVFFYQSFIPGCSAIAKPLFALTAGQKRRGQTGRSGGGAGMYRKLTAADWTPECEKAFQKLKTDLLNCAVLAHPDFSRPFILSVDASLDGLGAVLSQLPVGEDKARPIAFASKTLSKSQQRYPVHRLEFMALKWSVSEKFSHWLKGHDFTVWTDNNPLTHIMTKPKLDAYEQRWVAKLSSYNFDLKYIPGPKNVVADALSRDPFTTSVSRRLIQEPYGSLVQEAEGAEPEEVQQTFRLGVQHHQAVQQHEPPHDTAGSYSAAEVKAALASHSFWRSGVENRAWLCLGQHVQQLQPAGQCTLPSLTLRELEDKQLQDPTISSVLPFVVRRRRPSRRERHSMGPSSLALLKHWERLVIRNGVLYRETRDPVSRMKRFQLLLPASLRGDALKGVHD